MEIILEDSGSSLDRVIDVQAFLIDMDRDFKGYNKVYAEYFTDIQATRTTIAIRALPTPVEFSDSIGWRNILNNPKKDVRFLFKNGKTYENI